MEHAAFGIFRCEPDGTILDANAAFASMLGRSRGEDVLGTNLVREVLSDEGDRERWRQALDDGRVVDWLDLHCRRLEDRGERGQRGVPASATGDGVVRLRVALTTERDAAGRPSAVQGIAENVTERMRREEIVRRGERMASLGRSLAGVAHEINNPLAAIIGFAQILLRVERPAEDRHALETVLHEARRAARVVKDLLTIARREELVEKQRVELNGIVQYIVDTQRYAMETRGIRATVALAPSLPPIVADAAQVEQVVLNLVVNARQALETVIDRATPPAPGWLPRLDVRTWHAEGMVRLDVSDNGAGIIASDLPHIWDPFWTTKGEGEGSGLGLSVVHGIVTSHGGRIDATSIPEVDTRFTLAFPAAEVTPPAPLESRRGGGGTEPECPPPLDVLVVDDEAAICDILSRLLSARGHAVLTATGGEQALRLAETSGFDVVISDLRMPGIDGRELIHRLRRLPAFATTRFLLSTGDFTASEALAQRGDLPEGVVTVEKPYDLDALMQLIEGEGALPSHDSTSPEDRP